MKRIFMALIVVLNAISVFAQIHPSGRGNNYEMYYAIRVGAAFTNITCDLDENDASTLKGGLNISGAVGFPFKSDIPAFFETGLRLVEKGGIIKTDAGKLRVNGTYLEIPLLLKYQFDVYDDVSITPSVGGYLSLGLGGRVKDYINRETYRTFSDAYYERFEGGIHIGCAVSYNIFSIELDYQYGLSNISHSAFDTAHSNSLYLLFGVSF